MSTTHIALSVLGGSIDITGGLLVASGELVPRWHRVRGEVRRAADALAVKLGRRPRDHTIEMPFIESRTRVFSPALVAQPPIGAPLARQVDFLLDEAERGQRRLGDLEQRLSEVPAQIAAETERLRQDLVRRFSEQLAASRETYIRWRLLGIVLLAVGGAVQAAANLVS
jgi:hypothetical protein